ncbi:MAG: hypothetical protein NTZ85_15195 [Bacteroidia bacterium]|nr:hypothetical protein [Bacteroidia bacterium]
MVKQKFFSAILLVFFMFFFASNLLAQEVSNISFKQEGDKVVISYDITGKEGDLFNAIPYYSVDEGKTWTQLITVKGDLLNVTSGTNKTITWEVLKDVTGIKGAISFKIEAEKSKESIGDLKGFFIAGEAIGARTGYIFKKWGIDVSGLFYPRVTLYLSATRNIITRGKIKWNAGASIGRVHAFDSELDHLAWGPLYGLTTELQFKRLYFNIDLIYSPWESKFSSFLPVAGIGFVF